MTNNNFSFSRLYLILKITFKENFRKLAMQAIVMSGIVILAIWLLCLGDFDNNYNDTYYKSRPSIDPMWDEMGMIFTILVFGFSALASSMTATFMSVKAKRLTTLMLPATQLEKYISRLIIYSVLPLVILTIVFVLGDMMRVVFAMSMFPDCVFIHPLISAFKIHYFSFGHLLNIGLMVGCVMSVYTLGSYIWPKHSFVTTSIVAGAVTMIIVVVIVFLSSKLLNDTSYYYVNSSLIKACFFRWLMVIFIIFNYVVAYFRFKEDEIVKRW